ncbi:MAG TPA: hypothetical protein VHH54_01825, partial [Actinomycetota bacterium]|nr:hypothetical protein [Actinomycetota bacterium]
MKSPPARLLPVLAIFAAVALVFSAGLLVAPAFWITLYGGVPDPQATLLLRLVGALFSGLAAMAWAARRAEPSAAR